MILRIHTSTATVARRYHMLATRDKIPLMLPSVPTLLMSSGSLVCTDVPYLDLIPYAVPYDASCRLTYLTLS